MGLCITALIMMLLYVSLRRLWPALMLCALVAMQLVTPLSGWQATAAGLGFPSANATPVVKGALSKSDQNLYAKIFAAQEAGQMANADKLMWKLSDMRLRGHVLYQRYMHPTAYRSQYAELRDWLDLYADHPQAKRIYDLATRRAGNAEARAALRKPEKLRQIVTRAEPTMVEKQPYHYSRAKSDIKTVKTREKHIRSLLRKGYIQHALNQIDAMELDKRVGPAEADYLKSIAAESYLYSDNLQKALDIAQAAFMRSGAKVPAASWISGLIYWKNDNYKRAAYYFENSAMSPYYSSWMKAAASYWAARAHARLGNRYQVEAWLMQAQDHPRTFYGLLATQAAQVPHSFNWDKPDFTKDMRAHLESIPAVQRSLALLQLGHIDAAAEELLYTGARDKHTRKALLALATHYNLPALSLRLGNLVYRGKDHYYDAALYPTLPYRDSETYSVDPALVHAIARQESQFNPRAESHSGALGLMQIMPATARYVAKKYDAHLPNTQALYQPVLNLNLGEHYVHNLLRHPAVEDDLMHLLIAYNAGPGNLRKWQKRWDDVEDRLLFIELLPSQETRTYVEKVLANYWIYRMKQGRSLPTLQALSLGQPMAYAVASRDLPPYRLAQN